MIIAMIIIRTEEFRFTRTAMSKFLILISSNQKVRNQNARTGYIKFMVS